MVLKHSYTVEFLSEEDMISKPGESGQNSSLEFLSMDQGAAEIFIHLILICPSSSSDIMSWGDSKRRGFKQKPRLSLWL